VLKKATAIKKKDSEAMVSTGGKKISAMMLKFAIPKPKITNENLIFQKQQQN